MTKEDEQHEKNNENCRFCEKEIIFDKVRDNCYLTGKHWGPAHIICNTNVTQKQSNTVPFVIHRFRNYDGHLCFKKSIDKKNDEVNFDIIH